MARQLNRMMRVAIALVWTAAIAGVPTAAQDRWADATTTPACSISFADSKSWSIAI